MHATKQVKLKLSHELSNKAQRGHTYNYLKTGTLVSVFQLADDDCDTTFMKHKVKVFKNGKVVIKGYRNQSNGLWNIPLVHTAKPTILKIKHHALGFIQYFQTKQDLAVYLHACMFIPTTATFLRAVKKFQVVSWTGLAISLIFKHLTKALSTRMGHLRMQ